MQIRGYYDKKIKPELEGNAVVEIVVEAYKKKSNTIISKIYQGPHKENGDNTGYVKGPMT